MISKETLGRRIREVRQRNNLTLKDVEGISGLSSTHISEVERGMTCPTVGALIRIARALQKDPGYFIEERSLEEVCVTTPADRPDDGRSLDLVLDRARSSYLTRGVLGGRICAQEIAFDPDGKAQLSWLRSGQDVCFYCVEGGVHLTAGDQEILVEAGDSVHGSAPGPISIAAVSSEGARLLVISDPREDCR